MLNKSNIQPLFDNVLVRPLRSEKTLPSGIVLPDSVKEKPQVGEVMGTGPGKCCCEDGCKLDNAKCEMVVKKGDIVVYKKWGGNEVTVEVETGKKEEWMLIEQKDLMAVIKS